MWIFLFSRNNRKRGLVLSSAPLSFLGRAALGPSPRFHHRSIRTSSVTLTKGSDTLICNFLLCEMGITPRRCRLWSCHEMESSMSSMFPGLQWTSVRYMLVCFLSSLRLFITYTSLCFPHSGREKTENILCLGRSSVAWERFSFDSASHMFCSLLQPALLSLLVWGCALLVHLHISLKSCFLLLPLFVCFVQLAHALLHLQKEKK